MTPDERAAIVVQKLRDRRNSYTGELQDDIAAAIAEAEQAAKQAEREACADLADEWAWIWGKEYKRAPLKHMIPTAARAIGMKIRERNT